MCLTDKNCQIENHILFADNSIQSSITSPKTLKTIDFLDTIHKSNKNFEKKSQFIPHKCIF